jgi:hypothetical protein
MHKREGANSHILTGSREERATVNKRQQAEERVSRFSPPDRIQRRKSHCEQETTCTRESEQNLTL